MHASHSVVQSSHRTHRIHAHSAQVAVQRIAGLAELISGLFPPGLPVSTSAFLAGIAQQLHADAASLVFVQIKNGRLTMVDQVLLHVDPKAQDRYVELLTTTSAIARRVHRAKMHPFTHSHIRWTKAARSGGSLASYFMCTMGWVHGMISVVPHGDGMFSILSLHRMMHNNQAYDRVDHRMLLAAHLSVRDRLIEPGAKELHKALSPTMRDTFKLLVLGHSEKEIAREINRSQNTIHDHVKRIYAHFGVTSRAQLLARFVDHSKLDAAMRGD